MKRIVVDYKIPWLYPKAGIAGFFNPLLKGLIDRHPDYEFLLVAPGGVTDFPSDRPNCRTHVLEAGDLRSRLPYLRYSLATFPAFVTQSGADALLSPYYDFLLPRSHRGKAVVTVHDLCFLDLPEQYRFWTRWLHRALLSHNLPRAGGVITVSEFSRERLLARFPAVAAVGGAQVVYNSFTPLTADEPQGEAIQALRARLGLPPGMAVVLYTGGVDSRKNLDGLLAGFQHLLRRQEAVLLITGTLSVPSALRDQMASLGLAGRVILTGPLKGGEMELLYRAIAGCAVSVSHYEGFGRSAIEAKLSGLPFVSSDLPPVREMVGASALYCDRNNPADIGEKLALALATPRRRPETRVEERLTLARNVTVLSGVVARILGHGA